MRFFIIVAFLLQLSIPGYSQNTDSFASMEQNGKNLERFMTDYTERQKREKKQMYIRLGLGVAFLAVLVVSIVRRRRRMKNTQ
jgi:hypothetical protein